MTIDGNINWNSHIQKVSNKVSKSIGIINRLKRVLPLHILRTLYCSLVLPHLQYAILNWGFVLNRLSKLQKKAIRVISNSKYNAHTEPLLKKLNLLKLEDIFKINLLKLYFKYKSNMLPFHLMEMFKPHTQNHTYNFRSEPSLHHAICHTKGGEMTLRYRLPREIELTHHSIIDKIYTHSFKGFSQY